MPAEKMPGTLTRSPKKAQRTYEKTLESAEEQYGDGGDGEGHTKEELYDRAARLGVHGRSRMDTYELAQAVARAQD